MTNRKIIDYRVRIQVAEDSLDGVLLDFLKHERHPSFSHKEMVLWALRGYWMAIAFRQQRLEMGSASISKAKIQQIAKDSIYQLNQQIAYIHMACGLEQDLMDWSAFESVAISGVDRSVQSRNDAKGKQVAKLFVRETAAVEEQPVNGENWYGGTDLFDSSI
jgi:hypothetical protein